MVWLAALAWVIQVVASDRVFCYVLGQDTLLSQCLSLPLLMIAREFNARGVTLQCNSIPFRGGRNTGHLNNASAFGISCDGMRHLKQNRLNVVTTLPLYSVVSSNQLKPFFWHFISRLSRCHTVLTSLYPPLDTYCHALKYQGLRQARKSRKPH